MSEKEKADWYCPKCGLDCDELREGYCEECCKENQARLDLFLAELDWSEKVRREAQP
jgi:hypothetical protein